VTVDRVAVTEQAAEMIRRLRDQHGPLMFHQSGGCCDGSSPMCFADGDFLIGDSDVLLGELAAGTPEPVKIYMSVEQFEYWKHTHLTVDIVPGRGAGFSLEAPTGNRFLIRSRLFTDEEYAALGQESPAHKVGVQAAP
jgi:uncharacterized protein (DUF779 family)